MAKGDTINADTIGTSGKAQPVSGAGRTPLRIGSVMFNTEECPSELAFPVEQMMTETVMPGGGKITNVYGPDAQDVTWSGKFYAPNVKSKVSALRVYNVTGVEILLSWWFERYYVRVKRFTPKYKNENLADYEITVNVTRDANGALTVTSATTIDTQVQALLAQANKTNSTILTNANASTPAMLGKGSASTPNPASPQTFQQSLSTLNAVVQASLPIASQITKVGPPVAAAANNAVTAVTTYADAVGETDPTYGDALSLQASLLNIAGNVVRGQSPQTALLQSRTLFSVASQVYGDVTQAIQVAQANGFPSPFLSATKAVSVNLPPLQQSQ